MRQNNKRHCDSAFYYFTSLWFPSGRGLAQIRLLFSFNMSALGWVSSGHSTVWHFPPSKPQQTTVVMGSGAHFFLFKSSCLLEWTPHPSSLCFSPPSTHTAGLGGHGTIQSADLRHIGDQLPGLPVAVPQGQPLGVHAHQSGLPRPQWQAEGGVELQVSLRGQGAFCWGVQYPVRHVSTYLFGRGL